MNLVSLCGTPLHVAALHGQAGTMKILLEYHADVRHQVLVLSLDVQNFLFVNHVRIDNIVRNM